MSLFLYTSPTGVLLKRTASLFNPSLPPSHPNPELSCTSFLLSPSQTRSHLCVFSAFVAPLSSFSVLHLPTSRDCRRINPSQPCEFFRVPSESILYFSETLILYRCGFNAILVASSPTFQPHEYANPRPSRKPSQSSHLLSSQRRNAGEHSCTCSCISSIALPNLSRRTSPSNSSSLDPSYRVYPPSRAHIASRVYMPAQAQTLT